MQHSNIINMQRHLSIVILNHQPLFYYPFYKENDVVYFPARLSTMFK